MTQQAGTAYMGEGTTSQGQGVQIQQNTTGYKPQTALSEEVLKAKKETDEDKKRKQADLVMGAQQMGHMFVQKLAPEEKDLLVAGLKNKAASMEWKDEAEREKMETLAKEDLGTDIGTYIGQAPEGTNFTPERDPRDPANFAFYEHNKDKFGGVTGGWIDDK